jgi:hypothetical protein
MQPILRVLKNISVSFSLQCIAHRVSSRFKHRERATALLWKIFPKTERGQQQLVELLVVAGRPNMVHILERVPEVITHEDVHDRQS